MRILLVDDEESLRITLAANLELEGHEVVEAPDGQAALDLLKSVNVDLVLSDIRMPGIGGVELLHAIRASHPAVPVILMTAYTGEDQLAAAFLGGVFAVLKKPFDLGSALGVMARAALKPVVLVIDDDRAVAETVAAALQVSGLRAECAFTADEAIALVQSGRVDVCITDVVMPGTDGPTLAAALRERCPTLGVILFSGYDPRELLRRSPNSKHLACLTKPVRPGDLLRSVARARGGSGAV